MYDLLFVIHGVGFRGYGVGLWMHIHWTLGYLPPTLSIIRIIIHYHIVGSM